MPNNPDVTPNTRRLLYDELNVASITEGVVDPFDVDGYMNAHPTRNQLSQIVEILGLIHDQQKLMLDVFQRYMDKDRYRGS